MWPPKVIPPYRRPGSVGERIIPISMCSIINPPCSVSGNIDRRSSALYTESKKQKRKPNGGFPVSKPRASTVRMRATVLGVLKDAGRPITIIEVVEKITERGILPDRTPKQRWNHAYQTLFRMVGWRLVKKEVSKNGRKALYSLPE